MFIKKIIFLIIVFSLLINCSDIPKGSNEKDNNKSSEESSSNNNLIEQGITFGIISYSSSVNAFYNSSQGIIVQWSSQQNASNMYSQQIWSRCYYKGYYGSTWFFVGEKWKSRWGGGSLSTDGQETMRTYGSYTFRVNGKHLFDVDGNPSHFVYYNSVDYEDYLQ